MKVFLLIGAVVMFIVTAVLAFVGHVSIEDTLGFLAIGSAAFAASFLPIP